MSYYIYNAAMSSTMGRHQDLIVYTYAAMFKFAIMCDHRDRNANKQNIYL